MHSSETKTGTKYTSEDEVEDNVNLFVNLSCSTEITWIYVSKMNKDLGTWSMI